MDKTKVRKFWGLIPKFVVTEEKLAGGPFWLPHPE